jgi:hypothetical protein
MVLDDFTNGIIDKRISIRREMRAAKIGPNVIFQWRRKIGQVLFLHYKLNSFLYENYDAVCFFSDTLPINNDLDLNFWVHSSPHNILSLYQHHMTHKLTITWGVKTNISSERCRMTIFFFTILLPYRATLVVVRIYVSCS